MLGYHMDCIVEKRMKIKRAYSRKVLTAMVKKKVWDNN